MSPRQGRERMPPRDFQLDPRSASLPTGSDAIAQSLQLVKQHLRQLDRPVDSPQRSVHQLRVATRRASAALDLFSDSVRRKDHRRWKRRLKLIRKTAGQARDLDVLIERQQPQPQGDTSLLKQLRTQRRKAQKKLLRLQGRWKKGSPWSKQLKRLSKRLRSKALPKKQGRKKTTHIPSVRNALERFENRGRRPIRDLNALHDYRIQAKQLRYTLEWARPDLPKKPTTEVLKELKRIQNRLGAINDHATAIAILSQEKKGLKKQLRREKRMLKLAFERWIEFWNPERRLKFHANTRSLIQSQRSPVQPEPFDINLKFR